MCVKQLHDLLFGFRRIARGERLWRHLPQASQASRTSRVRAVLDLVCVSCACVQGRASACQRAHARHRGCCRRRSARSTLFKALNPLALSACTVVDDPRSLRLARCAPPLSKKHARMRHQQLLHGACSRSVNIEEHDERAAQHHRLVHFGSLLSARPIEAARAHAGRAHLHGARSMMPAVDDTPTVASGVFPLSLGRFLTALTMTQGRVDTRRAVLEHAMCRCCQRTVQDCERPQGTTGRL